MNKAIHSALTLVFASAVGGSGCQGSSPAPAIVPTISQTIGANGGTITSAQLGGVTLQVPQGALTQDTMITISMGQNAAQPGQTAVGPSLHFEPAGLAFTTPVTLTLPYALASLPAASELTVVSTVQDQHTDLPGGLVNVDSRAGTLSINVSQLTDYQVIATGHVLSELNNDVDILFMIDNSPSMTPKQIALSKNIPKFIQAIEAMGVNYHIGITTSDIGSWVAPGTPWGRSIGACDSYAGDDGQLQAVPCTDRTFAVNSPAAKACKEMCPDPSWMPNDGSSFISNINGKSNIAVPTGGDPTAATSNAFKCLALVGDQGCGIEGQMEGAKRALDGHNAQNAGFLRPNSLLTVVFITDEDDCSVQLAQRAQNNPATMDCTNPDQNASFACFNVDYRCMAMDVQCDEPMNQSGPHTNCTERPTSYLQNVTKYVDFFAGLRSTNRLYVGGIWTTPAVDKGGKLEVIQQTLLSSQSNGLNRDDGANAGCTYTGSDPDSKGIYGRPQLRLSKLARRFNGSMEVSICDTDRYATVLDNLAAAIGHKIGK